MSNSIDPDETALYLIWIYAVCRSLLLSPLAVKELNDTLLGGNYNVFLPSENGSAHKGKNMLPLAENFYL